MRKLIVFFYCSLQLCKAQIVASFTSDSSACINQYIDFQNNSSSTADYYSWDFCLTDIANTPLISSVGFAYNISNAGAIELVYDNQNWYGFISGRGDNHLYRLNFGSSLHNTFSINDLGTLNGILNQPKNLRFIKQNGVWIGLLVNVSNSLVRLNFSNGITDVPSAENLGNAFNLNAPIGLEIIQDNGNYIALVSNYGGNLSIVNFGNSLLNNPNSSNIYSFSVSPVSGSVGVSIVKDSDGIWRGLISSYNDGKVYEINFPNGLFMAPTFNFLIALSAPTEAKVIFEGSSYYGFVASQSGPLIRIEFGSSINNSVATVENLSTTLYYSDAFCLIKQNGLWNAFSIDRNTSEIYDIFFPQNCPFVNINNSFSYKPTDVKYNSAGIYSINLVISDSLGNKAEANGEITITTTIAPDITLSTLGKCIGSNVYFFANSSSSENIISSQWYFGDGQSSIVASPSHIYSAEGNFALNGLFKISNGCQNIAYDTIQIFNPPKASFTSPNPSPFCSNQNYVYTNTSTYDNGSNPTWQWSVNGATVDTTQNLTYLFSSTATQSVTLTASIPGCSTDSTQTIATLVDGPLVNFTFPATGCQGNAVSFANTTSGSTSSLSWSFGDGNTSVQSSATNSYLSTGTFPVTLNVTNDNGCQNYLTKNISIYSVPQPDFAIEVPPLSCANYPSQFDNNTAALTDSNITLWAWNFGDAANGSSTQQSPSYTYSSAANYNVSLTAISNFGCTATTQKSVTILPSPQAAFNFSPACVNQNTQFTDASTGTVTSYQWSIQNNPFTTRNPQYIFNASGSYPITFTVTASNGCKSQIIKTITVPVPPTIDFSTQAPCTNNSTTFQELYPNGSDPTVTWSWNFGQGSGSGSPVSHEFPAEGTYTITLNTTRQSGCVYSASKNISISTGPTADFTPSVEAGAAPLNVTFNNSSTATSYLWNFGDANNSTSTLTSPTFTYAELGSYKALLTASNSLGCSDTLSAWINVVIPHIDLVMNNFSLLNNSSSNSSEVIVSIFNAGNIPMINPAIDIDLGGNASVKENLMGTIRPGTSYQQTLNLGIVTQSLNYICIDVEATDDVDFANNKLCETLTNNDVVQTPYPNPAKEQVHFDWISSSQENVHVIIYTSTGEVVFEQTFDSVQEGLNQLSINTSSLSSGLYLIQFNGSKTSKTFKIAVAN